MCTEIDPCSFLCNAGTGQSSLNCISGTRSIFMQQLFTSTTITTLVHFLAICFPDLVRKVLPSIVNVRAGKTSKLLGLRLKTQCQMSGLNTQDEFSLRTTCTNVVFKGKQDREQAHTSPEFQTYEPVWWTKRKSNNYVLVPNKFGSVV